jgi:hypothetical protein
MKYERSCYKRGSDQCNTTHGFSGGGGSCPCGSCFTNVTYPWTGPWCNIAPCGDSICDLGNSEDCTTCTQDCGQCSSKLTSFNLILVANGESACGDGSCNIGEDCATCPIDCGQCPCKFTSFIPTLVC